jgi:hypothetical protein
LPRCSRGDERHTLTTNLYNEAQTICLKGHSHINGHASSIKPLRPLLILQMSRKTYLHLLGIKGTVADHNDRHNSAEAMQSDLGTSSISRTRMENPTL